MSKTDYQLRRSEAYNLYVNSIPQIHEQLTGKTLSENDLLGLPDTVHEAIYAKPLYADTFTKIESMELRKLLLMIRYRPTMDSLMHLYNDPEYHAQYIREPLNSLTPTSITPKIEQKFSSFEDNLQNHMEFPQHDLNEGLNNLGFPENIHTEGYAFGNDHKLENYTPPLGGGEVYEHNVHDVPLHNSAQIHREETYNRMSDLHKYAFRGALATAAVGSIVAGIASAIEKK